LGIFDKPQMRDGDLRDLVGTPLHIVGIGTREVTTIYGKNTAVDLHVEINGETKLYSGFSAGIQRQAKQATEDEFPLWAMIVDLPLGNGKSTTELVPCEPGQSVVADDDIPF